MRRKSFERFPGDTFRIRLRNEAKRSAKFLHNAPAVLADGDFTSSLILAMQESRKRLIAGSVYRRTLVRRCRNGSVNLRMCHNTSLIPRDTAFIPLSPSRRVMLDAFCPGI
jgi:hypothetical protein